MGNSSNDDHTPLGKLLGGIGFVTGFIIGWNGSKGEFLPALLVGLFVAGLGAFIGNVLWRLLIIALSIAMSVASCGVRQVVVNEVRAQVQRNAASGYTPSPSYTPALSPPSIPDAEPLPVTPTEPRLTAVCIGNPGDPNAATVAFIINWGGREGRYTLNPGQSQTFWAGAGAAPFALRFDDSLAEGSTDHTVLLPGAEVGSVPSCSDAERYDFVYDATRVGVVPQRWMPGFEHPYRAHMIRADAQDRWTCENGFKWTAPGESCIESHIGLIGIVLAKPEGATYPTIHRITPGSPAEAQSLVAGLYIMSVDGQSTADRTVEQLIGTIRGPVGTVVRLGIASTEVAEPRFVELKRQ